MTTCIIVDELFAVLSGDGDAAGTIEVIDNGNWVPGCIVTISSTTVPGKRFIISEQIGNTTLAVRCIEDGTPNDSGRTPMGAYLVIDGASISMENQVVRQNSQFVRLQKR